jgi:uncharacterized protein YndB with AHSA1/START domain
MSTRFASSSVAAVCVAAIVVAALKGAAAETFNRDVGDKRIVKEAVVAASPAAVWRAWTEPAVIAEFFAPRANVDLAIGGRYELLFLLDGPAGQQGSEGCTILSYIPGEMLSFSWNAPPKFAQARGQHTWVVVQLEALPDSRTRVRLTHYGFGRGEEWDQVHAYFERAWGAVMTSLVGHFNTAGKARAGG